MCVSVKQRKTKRRSELEAYLASVRLCYVSAAVRSDGRKLLPSFSLQLLCSIMSALSLITAHLRQPGAAHKVMGGGTNEQPT